MKIAVIGANGKAGQLIMEEAIARGHEVTAVIRGEKTSNAKAAVLSKDLFDLTYDDLENEAVIIDAFGTWAPETLHLHKKSLNHLTDILNGKPNRLIVVGSAGSLYVNMEHTMNLLESPDMPEIYKPLSTAMTDAFNTLKTNGSVRWTYFSPSAVFDAEGARSGEYRLGKDELLVNAQGQSYLSYADGAIAIVDEAEQGMSIGQRFTAVSK